MIQVIFDIGKIWGFDGSLHSFGKKYEMSLDPFGCILVLIPNLKAKP
jgi:hypothetical protein